MAAGAVACIGECLIDLIASRDHDLRSANELTIREGGAPMNVAVALARLGVASQMRAVVGGDQFGRRLIARMCREGVDTSHVRISATEPTTTALGWTNDRGDAMFHIDRHADRLLDVGDITSDRLDGVAAVVVGSVAMCAEPSRDCVLAAIRVAADRGIPIVADVNIRPGLGPSEDELRQYAETMIRAATLVKLSLDDAHVLWGVCSLADVARCLDACDPPFAVLTDGGRGAALRVEGQYVELPSFAVDAIEPTGAGDAFTAAMISRLVASGWSRCDEADLRFAMAAGALATTRAGALDGLPSREQVEAFLAARA